MLLHLVLRSLLSHLLSLPSPLPMVRRPVLSATPRLQGQRRRMVTFVPAVAFMLSALPLSPHSVHRTLLPGTLNIGTSRRASLVNRLVVTLPVILPILLSVWLALQCATRLCILRLAHPSTTLHAFLISLPHIMVKLPLLTSRLLFWPRRGEVHARRLLTLPLLQHLPVSVSRFPQLFPLPNLLSRPALLVARRQVIEVQKTCLPVECPLLRLLAIPRLNLRVTPLIPRAMTDEVSPMLRSAAPTNRGDLPNLLSYFPRHV